MSSVCFYFQVHQPYRLKHYSFFHRSENYDYFGEHNEQIVNKVAQKCYLPTNALLLDLIRKYDGAFRIAFSISGVALEQFAEYSPETLRSFQELVATGCVELLGETYYHSLASIYDEDEFRHQVARHTDTMCKYFGVRPNVFRNTELIYDDRIGKLVNDLGFVGAIAEGADDILGWRSPNFVYGVPGTDTALLLKNYKLSDDIAFRFSNRDWASYPLTACKFSDWVHQISGAGDTVNLFMDYETFGEHQWADSGIFDFMKHLPEYILRHPDWDFKTPSEVLTTYPRLADISFQRLTSWADMERDLTAWRGNKMQEKALNAIYALKDKVFASDNFAALDTWRKLQTSDHFYYMCTKWAADGDVHAYFSPYDNPYDAFINFQNVLRDFERTLPGDEQEAEAIATSL